MWCKIAQTCKVRCFSDREINKHILPDELQRKFSCSGKIREWVAIPNIFYLGNLATLFCYWYYKKYVKRHIEYCAWQYLFSNDHDAILISIRSNPILSCVSNITFFAFGQAPYVCDKLGDFYSQCAVIQTNSNYHDKCCKNKTQTNRANYVHIEYAFLNFIKLHLNDGNIVINMVNFVLKFDDGN